MRRVAGPYQHQGSYQGSLAEVLSEPASHPSPFSESDLRRGGHHRDRSRRWRHPSPSRLCAAACSHSPALGRVRAFAARQAAKDEHSADWARRRKSESASLNVLPRGRQFTEVDTPIFSGRISGRISPSARGDLLASFRSTSDHSVGSNMPFRELSNSLVRKEAILGGLLAKLISGQGAVGLLVILKNIKC